MATIWSNLSLIPSMMQRYASHQPSELANWPARNSKQSWWEQLQKSWCFTYFRPMSQLQLAHRLFTQSQYVPRNYDLLRQEMLLSWQDANEIQFDGEDARHFVRQWHQSSQKELYPWPLPHPFRILSQLPARDCFTLLQQDVAQLLRQPQYLPAIEATDGFSLAEVHQHMIPQETHGLGFWIALHRLPGVNDDTLFSQYYFAHQYHRVLELALVSVTFFHGLAPMTQKLQRFCQLQKSYTGPGWQWSSSQHYGLQIKWSTFQQAKRLLRHWRNYNTRHMRWLNALTSTLSSNPIHLAPQSRRVHRAGTSGNPPKQLSHLFEQMHCQLAFHLLTPSLMWTQVAGNSSLHGGEQSYFHFLYPSLTDLSRTLLHCIQTGQQELRAMGQAFAELDRLCQEGMVRPSGTDLRENNPSWWSSPTCGNATVHVARTLPSDPRAIEGPSHTAAVV